MALGTVNGIVLKHSFTKNEAPTPVELQPGEIAVNGNSGSPALYTLDESGRVIGLVGTGAKISALPAAPATPVVGDIWIDTTNPSVPVVNARTSTGWQPLASWQELADRVAQATQKAEDKNNSLEKDLNRVIADSAALLENAYKAGDQTIDARLTGITDGLQQQMDARFTAADQALAAKTLHSLPDVDDSAVADLSNLGLGGIKGILARDGNIQDDQPGAYKLIDVLDLGTF